MSPKKFGKYLYKAIFQKLIGLLVENNLLQMSSPPRRIVFIENRWVNKKETENLPVILFISESRRDSIFVEDLNHITH